MTKQVRLQVEKGGGVKKQEAAIGGCMQASRWAGRGGGGGRGEGRQQVLDACKHPPSLSDLDSSSRVEASSLRQKLASI